MLSKIKKSILILLMAFCLTGCCNIENTNPQQPVIENKEEEINCGYKYTYSCGFDAMSGATKCGYGYYYTCS